MTMTASIPAAVATLSCVCRTAMISLAALPIERVQCCCLDCRKGIDWCAEQGGPPGSTSLADLVYVPNSLCVVSGRERLVPYMIKEGYNTVRVVATCCWTPLLGDHPLYQQKRFVVYHPTLTLHDAAQAKLVLPPPTRRLFEGDLTPQELELLPPLSMFQQKQQQQLQLQQNTLTSAPPSYLHHLVGGKKHYETIQSLIESLGVVQYMDPEYDNGKQTKWNRIQAATRRER
jgi:hypothetical protein